jgi:phosphatidylglycerophosphate synthase
MKRPRVPVPLWFVLAMLASVAAISAIAIFIVAETHSARTPMEVGNA